MDANRRQNGNRRKYCSIMQADLRGYGCHAVFRAGIKLTSKKNTGFKSDI
jgi:hypothetical protein